MRDSETVRVERPETSSSDMIASAPRRCKAVHVRRGRPAAAPRRRAAHAHAVRYRAVPVPGPRPGPPHSPSSGRLLDRGCTLSYHGITRVSLLRSPLYVHSCLSLWFVHKSGDHLGYPTPSPLPLPLLSWPLIVARGSRISEMIQSLHFKISLHCLASNPFD